MEYLMKLLTVFGLGIVDMWVAILAPLVVGAPLGAVLGITLGAPVNRLLIWMSVGIVLWSAVFTFVGLLGHAGIEAMAR